MKPINIKVDEKNWDQSREWMVGRVRPSAMNPVWGPVWDQVWDSIRFRRWFKAEVKKE